MTLAIFTAQISNYHNARYRAVAATGADFVVISTQNDASFVEFMAQRAEGYPVERLYGNREEYLRGCAAGRVWQDVQHLLAKLDPEVVAVAGWATPESFAAVAWARKARRRIVMMSDSQQVDACRNALRERIKARVVSMCDAALVGGPPHRAYITALGLAEDRVHMGYDAVDNAHFQMGADRARADAKHARRTLGLPRRYLLASARFIPKKNLPRLIAAYGQAIAGLSNVPDLIILGDGPDRPEIEAAIHAEGLAARVHLSGFQGYDLLPVFYGMSEGFVHVSTSEQWGLVINEAAAAGVPVIASSACGATGSLVQHGHSGWVVDAQDTAKIAQALRGLITTHEDRRREMGLVGRQVVSNWDPRNFADELLAACRDAFAQPARSLSPWDAVLLQLLARQKINAVQ